MLTSASSYWQLLRRIWSQSQWPLKVAIVARSSREISQTVRIDWQYIMSRVRVSVRPGNVFIKKTNQKLSRKPSLVQVSVECRSIASDISGDNRYHRGERLNQNGGAYVKLHIILFLDRLRCVESGRNIQESAGEYVELVWACFEKRRRIRREESDGDGGAGEKKERKTKAEVVG